MNGLQRPRADSELSGEGRAAAKKGNSNKRGKKGGEAVETTATVIQAGKANDGSRPKKKGTVDKRLAKQTPLVRDEPSCVLDEVVGDMEEVESDDGSGEYEDIEKAGKKTPAEDMSKRLEAMRAHVVGGARKASITKDKGHHGVWMKVDRRIALSPQAEGFLGELATNSREGYEMLKDRVRGMARVMSATGKSN